MVLKYACTFFVTLFSKMESKSQPLERGLGVVIHLQRLECGRSDGVCLPRLDMKSRCSFYSLEWFAPGKSVALL